MRLFTAIELPDAQRLAVEAAMAPLRSRLTVNWVRDESLHVTLVFLGETTAGVSSAVDAVARRHRPLELGIEGAGTFGDAAHPRVLWLGVAGDLEAAAALQRDLEAALGTKSAHAGWTPHLTLARSKSPRGDSALAEGAAALGAFRGEPFTAAAVTLFESRGGRYRVLARSPLSSQIMPTTR